MISFDPLWRTMKQKNISQYKLIHRYGVSSSQINRLKNASITFPMGFGVPDHLSPA